MRIPIRPCFFVILAAVLVACGKASPAPGAAVTEPVSDEPPPAALPLPSDASAAVPDEPTPEITYGWSTTASTRTELSFGFPGEWDGSSPLTFGEGEFVKDPDQPIGVTFRIALSGDPAAMLADWGRESVGIVGIVTFLPSTTADAAAVTVARITAPTKTGEGDGITARVVYLPRAGDVLEIMWFAPTDQWEDLQPVFQQVLDSVEIWRRFNSQETGLLTMYLHDWLEPRMPPEEQGLWFQSADQRTGLLIYVENALADPAKKLAEWDVSRLSALGFGQCSMEPGDRMGVMGGQWESLTGECVDAQVGKITYEAAYVPNKDRVLEFITYAPSDEWAVANQKAFSCLLGMMLDIR
ncbi:MAG: hypothetical protein JW929_05235 [Anaerolineales bacterium]|nr:hypothetical protein [Anaerolineales bacterium]